MKAPQHATRLLRVPNQGRRGRHLKQQLLEEAQSEVAHLTFAVAAAQLRRTATPRVYGAWLALWPAILPEGQVTP